MHIKELIYVIDSLIITQTPFIAFIQKLMKRQIRGRAKSSVPESPPSCHNSREGLNASLSDALNASDLDFK